MVHSGPEAPFEMTEVIQNAIKSLYKVPLSEASLHYFDSKSTDTRILVDSSKKGTGFEMLQRCKRTGFYITVTVGSTAFPIKKSPKLSGYF